MPQSAVEDFKHATDYFEGNVNMKRATQRTLSFDNANYFSFFIYLFSQCYW